MDTLADLRVNGTIGEVLDHLKRTRRPRLSDPVAHREKELTNLGSEPTDDEPSIIQRQRQLRAIPYREVVELVKYIDGATPFATQHSVKGAEFENVLVVLGGGWNHYNWPQMLELLYTGLLNDKNKKGFYRARNLFYVAVSRPKKRLAVLITQPLPINALHALDLIFGQTNVRLFQL
jgi:DNA helicase II / ATP-dependent DNA helicase PcrA